MEKTGFARNTVVKALQRPPVQRVAEHPQRVSLSIEDGTVIVASDGHYWPGPASTAHRALVKFCSDLRPKAFILNGDAFDGSTISRHPPIGWESRPTVAEELAAVQERLAEITDALPQSAQITWNLGNHCARFETKLASVAPEFANVQGMHLKDAFPEWPTAWSTWINDDVVVKHRYKGGMHAPQANAMWTGRTTVTGHLHSAKVMPISDYNGTRWGIDTGCIAEPYGPQFVDYTEDGALNWRSGFAVLTFYRGRLLWPELVTVFDSQHVEWRGTVIAV